MWNEVVLFFFTLLFQVIFSNLAPLYSIMLFHSLQVCPTNGHRLADIFITLPDRSALPDYYEIIKKPVSIAQLQEQLYSFSFLRLDAFQTELFQMFRNARYYNEPNSQARDGERERWGREGERWRGRGRVSEGERRRRDSESRTEDEEGQSHFVLLLLTMIFILSACLSLSLSLSLSFFLSLSLSLFLSFFLSLSLSRPIRCTRTLRSCSGHICSPWHG